MSRLALWAITLLLVAAAPAIGHAQVFLASRPNPGFMIGPLFVRATVTPDTEVLRHCGPDAEEHEQLTAPDRRTLIYRGRRIAPQGRRALGWLATVRRWSVEQHEVEIMLVRGVVSDVQARVRRSPLAAPGP